MQSNELTELANKMAAAIARFEPCSQNIEQQQANLARQLPIMVQQKVDDVLQVLSSQAASAVREGLGPPTDELQHRLRTIAIDTDKTTRALRAAQADVASQRRLMWWGLGSVLVLCMISLVATYQSLYGFYHARMTQLKAKITYLEAVNKADVVRCGDGLLCARVDTQSPRYGDKKQYRVVAPRP